jgi:Pyruvate/2-oxoacid:ferredoxin oxidoreductase gamma subunit
VLGVVDTYDAGLHSPSWAFDTPTLADRVYETALRMAAAKHMAAHPDSWNSNTVLVAAFMGMTEMVEPAKQLIAKFDALPIEEQRKVANYLQMEMQRHFEREVA